MDNDDRQVGRILNRREILALAGAMGVTLLVACESDETATPSATTTPGATQPATATGTASPTGTAPATETASATATETAVAVTQSPTTVAVPACIVRPELTEGPYFVDEMLDRSDIRVEPSDGSVKEGTPLALAFAVSQIADGACTALAGAQVDVWHCDAFGVYSDVSDPGFDTSGQKWLRGYQVTDQDGAAAFSTIYPGWYSGRTVHIHFKIRTEDGREFTSQLFFDDALTDEAYRQEPYASTGERSPRNDGDSIFGESNGLLTLALAPTEDGYAATFEIALEA